jgi:hypothetical protein
VLVVEGIENLMKMRSAGDLVIYGTDSPDGDVSFIREHGTHAGPGASEMHTFIVGPWFGATPCRRATELTVMPGSNVSSTI